MPRRRLAARRKVGMLQALLFFFLYVRKGQAEPKSHEHLDFTDAAACFYSCK